MSRTPHLRAPPQGAAAATRRHTLPVYAPPLTAPDLRQETP